MKYTEEMILHSSSGYCMPFEEQKGKEVEMLFGYVIGMKGRLQRSCIVRENT